MNGRVMGAMFRRYSNPARRAIFFAREIALHAGSNQIDSTHLLSGLLVEQSTQVNRILLLSSRFADETARLKALKRVANPKDIPLSPDGKKIVGRAATEADLLNEYWIDTDHLMLAMLSESSCAAAVALHNAGFKLEETRRVVSESTELRENYGAPPLLWGLEKPVSRMGKVRAFAYLLFLLILIGVVTENRCG